MGETEASDDYAHNLSTKSSAQIVTQTVKQEIANWVVEEPMRQVVRRGTGKKAELPGFEVFGKSGTAQKLDPATGKYAEKRYVCSFVCGAPATNPRALVLVLVDEPTAGTSHFGGTVAAPPASRILEKTLQHRHKQKERLRTASNPLRLPLSFCAILFFSTSAQARHGLTGFRNPPILALIVTRTWETDYEKRRTTRFEVKRTREIHRSEFVLFSNNMACTRSWQ